MSVKAKVWLKTREIQYLLMKEFFSADIAWWGWDHESKFKSCNLALIPASLSNPLTSFEFCSFLGRGDFQKYVFLSPYWEMKVKGSCKWKYGRMFFSQKLHCIGENLKKHFDPIWLKMCQSLKKQGPLQDLCWFNEPFCFAWQNLMKWQMHFDLHRSSSGSESNKFQDQRSK